MLKKLFFLGLISGLLAGATSLIYAKLYSSSLGCDFSTVAGPIGIVTSSLFGCMLAALGYGLLKKWLPKHAESVFNILFFVLSFVSVFGAFVAKLPLTIEAPELFPGLVVPMHFFPVLAWFTVKPIILRAK